MDFLVVGAGFGEQHLTWISECPGARVRLIGYRRDGDRARRLAARFPGATATADPLSAITAGAVDALVVASPPDTHERYLAAGLAAGLRVVSDKPLAHDLPTAARLAEAAAGHPGRAAVSFQWRANRALRVLRELCARGELGELVHLDLDFRHDFLAGPRTAWPWRHRWETAGAGALGDQGVHLFDLLAWLAPGSWAVTAGTASVVWPRRSHGPDQVACETDDVAEVLLGRDDGAARARVFVSRVSTGERALRVRVQGADGSAEVSANPDDGSATLRRHPAGSSTDFGPDPMNPYPGLLSGDDPVTVADFTAGHAAQALVEQALRAGCDKPISH
ncbi:hypothetical protein Acsp05_07400 [Actinokineospora sp. NBRC 105648]|nr:Gfo/Idh/MocA family oxidoreductase [Actinokineospora sp. NBRC 105648]GLZ37115.1 hypothetical protein Acsp05_07400 [Actinokineospora sp. NBRC 105648]